MITIATVFESLKSRADRSWTITMSTNELTPQQVQELASLLHEYCFCALKRDAFRRDEVEMLDHLETELDFKERSRSKLLRNVLYVLWKQRPEGYEDFQLFYNFKMDKVIEHYKAKLE